MKKLGRHYLKANGTHLWTSVLLMTTNFGNGHFAGGEGLQDARNAITLRWSNHEVAVTDGPFAETKEQIGGIMILEASDLTHAIRLLSAHPSLRLGRGGSSWEIRPAADLTPLIDESRRRREG